MSGSLGEETWLSSGKSRSCRSSPCWLWNRTVRCQRRSCSWLSSPKWATTRSRTGLGTDAFNQSVVDVRLAVLGSAMASQEHSGLPLTDNEGERPSNQDRISTIGFHYMGFRAFPLRFGGFFAIRGSDFGPKLILSLPARRLGVHTPIGRRKAFRPCGRRSDTCGRTRGGCWQRPLRSSWSIGTTVQNSCRT